MGTKKRTWRVMVCSIVAVILTAPAIGASTVQAATDTSLQDVLQTYTDDLHDAGVTGVLAEVRQGVIYNTKARSGKAVRGSNMPVPWNARFRTGSTTKTFVSTVILQLVAEGKMSLGDSVQDWLPGLLQGNGYDGSQITVRQLLNHTSGIFDYTSDETFFDTLATPENFYANRFRNYTPQQLIAMATAHPPVFAPGTSWDYSNTNYAIAGLIIKAITGHSWNTEVRNRILLPLGLTETSFAGNNATIPHPHARAYHIYTTDSTARSYTDTTLHNMSWAFSAGDIITTTRDENRFFRALMKGWLLPPVQLAEMKTVVPVDETFSYGLGIMKTPSSCDQRGIWGHDGGTVGFSTTNGVTDDGRRSIVVSLSTTTFSDLDFADQTVQLRTDIVDAALCYGQATTHKRATPEKQPVSPTLKLLRQREVL